MDPQETKILKIQNLFASYLDLAPKSHVSKNSLKNNFEKFAFGKNNKNLCDEKKHFYQLENRQKTQFFLLSVVSESFFKKVYLNLKNKEESSDQFLNENLLDLLEEGSRKGIISFQTYLKEISRSSYDNNNNNNSNNNNNNNNDNRDNCYDNNKSNNYNSTDKNKNKNDKHDYYDKNHNDNYNYNDNNNLSKIQLIGDLLYELAEPLMGDENLSSLPSSFFSNCDKCNQDYNYNHDSDNRYNNGDDDKNDNNNIHYNKYDYNNICNNNYHFHTSIDQKSIRSIQERKGNKKEMNEGKEEGREKHDEKKERSAMDLGTSDSCDTVIETSFLRNFRFDLKSVCLECARTLRLYGHEKINNRNNRNENFTERFQFPSKELSKLITVFKKIIFFRIDSLEKSIRETSSYLKEHSYSKGHTSISFNSSNLLKKDSKSIHESEISYPNKGISSLSNSSTSSNKLILKNQEKILTNLRSLFSNFESADLNSFVNSKNSKNNKYGKNRTDYNSINHYIDNEDINNINDDLNNRNKSNNYNHNQIYNNNNNDNNDNKIYTNNKNNNDSKNSNNKNNNFYDIYSLCGVPLLSHPLGNLYLQNKIEIMFFDLKNIFKRNKETKIIVKKNNVKNKILDDDDDNKNGNKTDKIKEKKINDCIISKSHLNFSSHFNEYSNNENESETETSTSNNEGGWDRKNKNVKIHENKQQDENNYETENKNENRNRNRNESRNENKKKNEKFNQEMSQSDTYISSDEEEEDIRHVPYPYPRAIKNSGPINTKIFGERKKVDERVCRLKNENESRNRMKDENKTKNCRINELKSTYDSTLQSIRYSISDNEEEEVEEEHSYPHTDRNNHYENRFYYNSNNDVNYDNNNLLLKYQETLLQYLIILNEKAAKRQNQLKELLIAREMLRQEVEQKEKIMNMKKNYEQSQNLNDDRIRGKSCNEHIIEISKRIKIIKLKVINLKDLIIENNRQTLDPEVLYNPILYDPLQILF